QLFSAVALYSRLHGRLNRDEQRSRSFRSALSTHPILYTPNSDPGFTWFIHPPKSAAFVPVLRTRRNHPTPCSPSITARLTFTRLIRFTSVTGCMLARAHGLGRGPRLSGVAPRFSRHPRVRHSYTGNEPTPAAGLSPARY